MEETLIETGGDLGKQKLWRLFLLSKKYRILRHALLFTIFLLLYVINPQDRGYTAEVNFYAGIVDFIYIMLVFYFNIYFLVPKLLLKGKVYQYVLAVLMIGVITFLIICSAEILLSDYRVSKDSTLGQNWLSGLIYFLTTFIILISFTTAIKVFQYLIIHLEKLNQIQKLNFQNELSILKNQISPHFLFNTLNNINILTDTNPKLASKLIINLSDLLRYQIYDGVEDSILLSADVTFIKNFLFVESLRKDNFKYDISFTGSQKDIFLPPLLFIPFVENSVKHIDNENPLVKVNFHLENNNLKFVCINSTNSDTNQKQKNEGIGLTNIKKRLQLLFPQKHDLKIENKDNVFKVELNLTL
ncbi:histidine kinase [Chryseobacterium sp. ISL-6]|uniref:sensor histidine kinase n=1 Tax=Chryseobacterium sp. ISL-6 TaxID=2819143 RepID=UPI001BEB0B97|nr:histidine kinase [Chryseobacterium sp. ISL-6]MBT2619840.1 histidine kinase [Chryseobacterium sp. ISL-6]